MNDFNRFGRLFKVYVQAEPEYRRPGSRCALLFRARRRRRHGAAEFGLVDVSGTQGPDYTNRFNLFRAAEVTGQPAPGYSSAQALAALEEVARETLPSDMTFSWNAMSYQEKAAEGSGCAGVPAGDPVRVPDPRRAIRELVDAASACCWVRRSRCSARWPGYSFRACSCPATTNNVFAQIGLVMLIGLAAKNAILIVEFAKLKREAGASAFDAAMEAARERFRPILMTAFSFILGVIPLLIASGAGAEARKVMGMTVFSGMLTATLLGVILVPSLFVLIDRIANRGATKAVAETGGMRAAIAALACLGLGACAIGPDYERPELDLPEEYRSAQYSGDSIANLPWFELFQDPVLQQLVETALVENNDLKVAAARVEEARARYGFVRADQFPQIGVQGEASTTEPGDIVINFGRIDNFALAATLDWELDFWGRLRRLTEAQRAELLATEEAQRSVLISLISDVASAYLLLLDLDQRLDISQRTLASREKSLDIIQARFDKGTVPLLDVNQADIQAAEAQAAVAELDRSIVQAENLLAVLLGRSPEPIIRNRNRFATLTWHAESTARLPIELLERRPDVRQAEQSLAAQTARIGAAQALRLPTFSLTGSLGLASQDLSNFASSDAVTWGIGATLFGPLIDWGKNKRRVEVEKAITASCWRATSRRCFRHCARSTTRWPVCVPLATSWPRASASWPRRRARRNSRTRATTAA